MPLPVRASKSATCLSCISLSFAEETIPVAIGCSEFCSRSEEHTSELQSRFDLVCRLLLEKKNHKQLCGGGANNGILLFKSRLLAELFHITLKNNMLH